MRKKTFISVLLILLLQGFISSLLTAQNTGTDTESNYVAEVGDQAVMNWTTKVLRVKGSGFGPENVKELGRRKILAKRAAQMDAYRNLLEAVKGVYLTSHSSVRDLMVENDSIRAKTEGMLKGMQVVDVTYNNEGGCEVTVEVNIDNVGGFLLAALSDQNVNVTDDYPKFDWIAIRKELEQTKSDLASTRGKLAVSQKNLSENRSKLEKTQEELEDIKSQYAALKDDFDQKQEELLAANAKLIRAEEKLNYANLREADLKDALDKTSAELDTTKVILTAMRERLIDKNIELAVNRKELDMTRLFLEEKKGELDNLSSDLETSRSGWQKTPLDVATLKGYIYRLKQVQVQTRVQVETIQPFLETARPSFGDITSQYTGLLIDARDLKPKPVLAPSILNENREKVYGVGVTFISITITSVSLVDYISGDLEKAGQHPRVGNNPLIIKALKVVNGSDLMISNEDVKRLPGIIPVLKQRKVTVLL